MKIRIKVTFGKENKILGIFGECVKVRINARPEKGKANKELISFLAEQLGIPKSLIAIISGHTSRTKTLELPDEAYQILVSLID